MNENLKAVEFLRKAPSTMPEAERIATQVDGEHDPTKDYPRTIESEITILNLPAPTSNHNDTPTADSCE